MTGLAGLCSQSEMKIAHTQRLKKIKCLKTGRDTKGPSL